MELSTPLLDAAELFIQSLPEHKRQAAGEILNLLCSEGIYPISAQEAYVKDLQICSEDPSTIAEYTLDFKILTLLDGFENDATRYCVSIFFLLEFYIFLKSECPEFKIPIGNLTADRWVECTSIFARVHEQIGEKCGKPAQELFKEFIKVLGIQATQK